MEAEKQSCVTIVRHGEAKSSVQQSAMKAQEKPEAPAAYEAEWNYCLNLAFYQCGMNYLTKWEAIPATIADFFVSYPDAPIDAAIVQVSRIEKVVLMPNVDQRRLHLALRLFRDFIVGDAAILQEDEKLKLQAEQAKQQPANAETDPSEGAYAYADDRDTLSDLGKAASAREAQSQTEPQAA